MNNNLFIMAFYFETKETFTVLIWFSNRMRSVKLCLYTLKIGL